MKLKFFIPFLLATAFVLMVLNTAALGVAASWALRFTQHEYGYWNLVILRGFAMTASLLVGLLALPLGYLGRRMSAFGGVLLAVLGLMIVINPWNETAMSTLKTCLPEYSAYVLVCWGFWSVGTRLAKHNQNPNPTPDGIRQPVDGAPKPSV